MAQIGKIPEIIEIKEKLECMKQDQLVAEWELPYESLLTRLSAAIFFLTPCEEEQLPKIWGQLSQYNNFKQQKNTDRFLSQMDYRVEFTPDK